MALKLPKSRMHIDTSNIDNSTEFTDKLTVVWADIAVQISNCIAVCVPDCFSLCHVELCALFKIISKLELLSQCPA